MSAGRSSPWSRPGRRFPWPPGTVYGYDLGFRRQAGDPGDDGPAEADLGSLRLLGQLGYRPGHRPSCVLPPERLEQVRLVHGSCRKPHGQRRGGRQPASSSAPRRRSRTRTAAPGCWAGCRPWSRSRTCSASGSSARWAG